MSAPARLISVRLQGFKSFADRTQVMFGPGISAVVGPNGSGKSNLADALRWALGEQGRALRSRKSEDVIWAGSERRPAVGMADVQLTVDNSDGLLPVEYGMVELGRRLYRSGENDYLLNRQRVRLRDLVELLDSAHLADNAFLFIGQGMVDQALALRPEERRPLFEEVAGVRRHDRRRRRAEEQLVESEANLARVEDILTELRPQARRLAAQAEQQASRRSAGDDLAAAIVASAHARWHGGAGRLAETTKAAEAIRAAVDAAMATLLEHERAIADVGATLAGHASAEAEARGTVDRARAERAAVQLRESRHASELTAAVRERQRLAAERAAAESLLENARRDLAISVPQLPAELEEELAEIEGRLAELSRATAATGTTAGTSEVDAAVIRRLEAARAAEVTTARRRAAEAEQQLANERERATRAREAAVAATTARETAGAEAAARAIEEADVITRREAAQSALADVEAAARLATDRAATAAAIATALAARQAEAVRALDASAAGAFDHAAKSRGGRPIADGVTIDPTFRAAVDAALAELGRAQLLAREAIGPIAGALRDAGTAIVAEALAGRRSGNAEPDKPTERFLERVRSLGGGRLVDAVRRDEPGAVTGLLARVAWLPAADDALELQAELPPGWLAAARDGSMLVAEVAVWIRPEGRGLHLRADADRLASEAAAAERSASAAAEARIAAERIVADGRATLAAARDHETAAVVARRRAEELARSTASTADTTAREAAWLGGQVDRLEAEAARLRAAVPLDPAEEAQRAPADTDGPAARAAAIAPAAAAAEEQRSLRARRDALAGQLTSARAGRADAERRRATADATAGIAERQIAQVDAGTADLAEREGRLALDREELVGALAETEHAVAAAESTLTDVLAAGSRDREQLREADTAATAAREALRIRQERARLADRDELEARLALEGLHEQLGVELAGLGPLAIRHLVPTSDLHLADGGATEAANDAARTASEDAESAPGNDLDPVALEAALATAAETWRATPPPADPPTPGRLANLRRRFHELGAGNPFAADEYTEAKARLDGLETQRTDLHAAIDHTRELIRELDHLIADQFRRTFTALERAFDARFQQLFGGGFAKLSLTDPGDLASTGVEIVARPPGKKPQALSMLSGGERALTAVALLFAMLEVRPVPFCVLDEVDAALDEANVGRFTDALRELARTTQCIVITHNRGTIETADALYGVTVGDDSASRVISLRLEEATALAARSRAGRGARSGSENAGSPSMEGPALELAVGD